MSPLLAVAIFITMPISLAVSRIYIKKMRRLNRDVRDSDSRIQSVLQESLQHKELIKSLERNDSTEQQLSDLQNRLQSQVASRTKFSLGAYNLDLPPDMSLHSCGESAALPKVLSHMEQWLHTCSSSASYSAPQWI